MDEPFINHDLQARIDRAVERIPELEKLPEISLKELLGPGWVTVTMPVGSQERMARVAANGEACFVARIEPDLIQGNAVPYPGASIKSSLGRIETWAYNRGGWAE